MKGFIGCVYAYAVASKEEFSKRISRLSELNIPDKNIYSDIKEGNAKNARSSWNALAEKIGEGDILYCQSFDDLGRDCREILDNWNLLTREKEADIAILDYPLLDTRWRKDVLGDFVSEMVRDILGYMAGKHEERLLIQRKGIREAMEQGVRFGRPKKELPGGFGEALASYLGGEKNLDDAAASCGMSRSTFYRKTKEYGNIVA